LIIIIHSITVTPTSGLTTTEAGGTSNFNVTLDSKPTDNVTVSIASSDTTEGTVSVSSLTFTPTNWNTAQTVTVTGVNDDVDDDNQAYNIVTGVASSTDAKYNGVNPDDVSVSNTDDDIAGFTVTPTSGLTTTEAGGQATFDVTLDSKPTDNVTVSIASSDTTEGTVSVSSLTFTTTNWNTVQTVTVTGVNDDVDDDDQGYNIVTGVASSTDAKYNGIDPTDVSVSNTDDDTAGFTVTPTSGLTTTEAGGQATFDVTLDTKPTDNVTVSIASSDTTEGTVSASSLTFTATNWNTAQTVTITGVDDNDIDGNIAYNIITGAATSTDAKYNGINPTDVSVSNTDDDIAGFTITPTSGLTTTEAGGIDTFNVVLDTKPTADVTIAISSSDTTEGTVSVSSLTFTTTNWNTAQTVTVTGVNDDVDDDNQAYTIITGATTSADLDYNGLNPTDVSISNTDDDTAGITVTPTSGLTTTEAGGQATFNVVLDSKPTDNVTISISSSDTTEGTVSASSLTFTAANWNVAQTVTVTGVDDNDIDGNIAYNIITSAASSTDAKYNTIDPSDVSVSNTDDDIAGFTITPTSGLITTEVGGIDTFNVVLDTKPTADVTIAISSSDTTEGTISVSSLTFTPTNWNTAQTITVTGVSDDVDDDNQAYSIVTGAATSADLDYNGLNPTDVSISNTDDDTAGITVTPTSGLTTTEAGGQTTFNVVLDSKTTDNVTISVSSSDTTEGTVSVSSLTFTAANWNVAQTVTVTGADDNDIDGNIAYNIITGSATSTDAKYNTIDPSDVSVTNTDDDVAGFTITPTSGLTTTEAGGIDTFNVVLDTKPTADVTISVSSSDTTEGPVSVSSLTFTPTNWNTAQTVTVTGFNDDVDDDDQEYNIVTGVASSTDAKYNGVNPDDVSITNTDDDTAGFTVTPTSGLTTTEAGGQATFDVTLDSKPTDNVTVSIASSDTTEGTVSVRSLTFTPTNWNTAQTITVTGVNDDVDDDNQAYNIVTGVASSTDAKYNGVNPSDVSVSNTDNDTAGITVTPTSELITTETGESTSFDVVLSSQPYDDVILHLNYFDWTYNLVETTTSNQNGIQLPIYEPLINTTTYWGLPKETSDLGLTTQMLDISNNEFISYNEPQQIFHEPVSISGSVISNYNMFSPIKTGVINTAMTDINTPSILDQSFDHTVKEFNEVKIENAIYETDNSSIQEMSQFDNFVQTLKFNFRDKHSISKIITPEISSDDSNKNKEETEDVSSWDILISQAFIDQMLEEE